MGVSIFMLTRSQEREQAFLLLFEQVFQPELTPEELIHMALESEYIEPSAFTEELLNTVKEHREEIDEKIAAYSVSWSMDRMSKVSLSILRLALAEILYLENVPVGVSINEAVELAKKYAGKEDSAFINGILGSFSRKEL